MATQNDYLDQFHSRYGFGHMTDECRARRFRFLQAIREGLSRPDAIMRVWGIDVTDADAIAGTVWDVPLPAVEDTDYTPDERPAVVCTAEQYAATFAADLQLRREIAAPPMPECVAEAMADAPILVPNWPVRVRA